MNTKTKKVIKLPTSKVEARIAIAKDVIKHLNVVKATEGIYYNLNGPINNEDLQTELRLREGRKDGPYCQACALGSMLLSFSRLWDRVKLPRSYDCNVFISPSNRSHSIEHLSKYFSQTQLDQIEGAFECCRFIAYTNTTKAAAFGGQYDDETDRLRAIMKNIIKNKGKFVPPAIKVTTEEAAS